MANEGEKLYRAATIETDGSKLEERIEAADFAMHARLHESPSIMAARVKEENRAIAEALNRLDVLRSEVAAWKSSPAD
jgi:hypothetical protein